MADSDTEIPAFAFGAGAPHDDSDDDAAGSADDSAEEEAESERPSPVFNSRRRVTVSAQVPDRIH